MAPNFRGLMGHRTNTNGRLRAQKEGNEKEVVVQTGKK